MDAVADCGDDHRRFVLDPAGNGKAAADRPAFDRDLDRNPAPARPNPASPKPTPASRHNAFLSSGFSFRNRGLPPGQVNSFRLSL
jgi:hypothetical protein